MGVKGSEFLGGVLIGAVIGAALGLLLAPQTGEELRESVGNQARDLGERMKESGRQMMDSGRDLLEQGKSQIARTMKSGAEKQAAGEAGESA